MQIEFEAPPGAQVVEGSMTTPAHSAAQAGRLSHLVQALKDDPELVNMYISINGATPLSYASRRGHLGCVEYLIRQGAEVDAADIDGLTPLAWAARTGHLPVVEVLISHKANTCHTTIEGAWNPLKLACFFGHGPVVAHLLKFFPLARLDDKDHYNFTCVSLASVRNKPSVLKLLLDAGADPASGLPEARFRRHKACVDLLEKALAEATRIALLQKLRSINDATHANEKASTSTETNDDDDGDLAASLSKVVIDEDGHKGSAAAGGRSNSNKGTTCNSTATTNSTSAAARASDSSTAATSGDTVATTTEGKDNDAAEEDVETEVERTVRKMMGGAAYKSTTEEEKDRRRKCIAAAPAFLKARVCQQKALPKVTVIGTSASSSSSLNCHRQLYLGGKKGKMMILADTIDYVCNGDMVKEVYQELMAMMIPRWDPARQQVARW